MDDEKKVGAEAEAQQGNPAPADEQPPAEKDPAPGTEQKPPATPAEEKKNDPPATDDGDLRAENESLKAQLEQERMNGAINELLKIVAPGVNQHADAYDLHYRKYHDIWLPDNALDAVRVCVSPAPAQG
jgi:hypothetical protein